MNLVLAIRGCLGNAREQEVIDAMNAYSEEKIGVTITFLPTEVSEYMDTIARYLAAKDDIDICFMANYTGFVDLARQGALMDLTEYVHSPEYEKIYGVMPETIWEGALIDGKGFYGRELMAVTDGEVLAGFEDGYPAVVARGNLPPASAEGDGSHASVRNEDDRNPASMETNDRNSVVKKSREGGCVIMINTFLWYGYALTKNPAQAAFAESLFGRLGVKGSGTNPVVKLKLCKGARGMVLFVFNYTGEEQKTEYEADDGRRIALVVAPQEAAVKQLT